MRRVKRIEIGKLVFSLLILSMVAITSGCGDSSKALEVNRELKAVNDEMPLYDGSYVIEEAHYDNGMIVVAVSLDSDFMMAGAGKMLQTLRADSAALDAFKERMMEKCRDIADVAQARDLDICWRFYAAAPGDGFDLVTTPDDVTRLTAVAKEKERSALAAYDNLLRMTENINRKLPEDAGLSTTLHDVSVKGYDMVYNYLVDENATSFAKIEPYLVERNKRRMSAILDGGIGNDSILAAVAAARLGIIYRYTGTRTGFVHDYQIVTRDELSSLTTDNGQLPTENQQPKI